MASLSKLIGSGNEGLDVAADERPNRHDRRCSTKAGAAVHAANAVVAASETSLFEESGKQPVLGRGE
jgi:hypothetical protein